MKKLLFVVIVALAVVGCARRPAYDDLQRELDGYVVALGNSADVGIAVIIDGKDIVAVNGDRPFPMLSVYKFPIAMAVAEKCRVRQLSLSDSCLVYADALHPDTYSPMLQRYDAVGADGVAIALRELLEYSIQQSDNNASDILLDWVGSAPEADGYIAGLGVRGIDIVWSEDEMYADNSRAYDNTSTPKAMASLLWRFHREFTDSISLELKRMMETCLTGTDRLAAPLRELDGVILGHKTGTGFRLPDGRLMAVNDAGYVVNPYGPDYSIAIFVANSSADMAATSAIIADLSAIVARRLVGRQAQGVELGRGQESGGVQFRFWNSLHRRADF